MNTIETKINKFMTGCRETGDIFEEHKSFDQALDVCDTDNANDRQNFSAVYVEINGYNYMFTGNIVVIEGIDFRICSDNILRIVK